MNVPSETTRINASSAVVKGFRTLSTVLSVRGLRRTGMDVPRLLIWVVRGRICFTKRREEGDSRGLFIEVQWWWHKICARVEYTCDFLNRYSGSAHTNDRALTPTYPPIPRATNASYTESTSYYMRRTGPQESCDGESSSCMFHVCSHSSFPRET